MRLMLLCTALCVASPTYAASPEYPSATIPLPDKPPATADVASPITEDALSPVAVITSDRPIIPSPLDEIGQEPSAKSGINASGQERQEFSKTELCSTVASVATANNLPILFFANLIHQESGFKSHVVSPVGAQGIAQFMPRVAASYGLANPFDPIAALTASGKLLAELVGQFGNLGLAAAAYNAGPKRVQDWMAKRRGLPAETRHYVQSITGRAAEQWVVQGGKDTELSLPPHARCPDLLTAEGQGNELIKSTAQTAKVLSLPIREATVSKTFVRRSMPQPSQFAMGLPVSRFAAMATPLVEKKSHDRRKSGRANLKARLDTLMRQFASMATPTIMVEENAASHARPSERAKPKADTKVGQRFRVAAAH